MPDGNSTRDGRRWNKTSETQWAGYEKVRFSNCRGSLQCTNESCDFKKEYGLCNNRQFDKKTNACRVCGESGKYIPCTARKYIAKRASKLLVYYCDEHTCPFTAYSERATDDVRRKVAENLDATPAQIQSSVILTKLRQCRDWSEVEKAVTSVSDKRWISNEKARMKQKNEPYGHDLEAVAHFKEYTDVRDPYYIYKLKYNSSDKFGGQSYVFKTSKLKIKCALNMDRAGERLLKDECCYFDGKVKRCKGFVSLTASVYHPMLRKLIPLATMECSGENTSTIALFWSTFNDVLKKESGDANYVFNPRGWITDMAGANIQGLKNVFGTSAVDRIKTCEFHFKDFRNRQARKLDEANKSRFKKLCNALLQAATTPGYEAAQENLLHFTNEDDQHKFLQSWFEWWDNRRGLIFSAFTSDKGGSRMNQAETIHASWVKRDRPNLSLLDAAHADVRDNIQLEVEYRKFQDGSSRGGTGPSISVQQSRETAQLNNRARVLGQELIRDDISDSDIVRTPENEVKDTNLHDKHNASVRSGPRRTEGERDGRYRPTRSKIFLSRLQNAKKEKDAIKVIDTALDKNNLKCYTLATNSSRYKVTISKKHSCQCLDFSKKEQNELCKHIIWTLLYICKIPEDRELLHQVYLTENESSQILANTPEVSQDLRYSPGSKQQSRQDVVRNLLLNDTRNGKPKMWFLKRKESQRGPTPRCRSCRKEQIEGDLSVLVVGLYVPYEQNFVVETTFYFCPSAQCVKRIPPWINLTPPNKIIAHESVTCAEIEILKTSDALFGRLLSV